MTPRITPSQFGSVPASLANNARLTIQIVNEIFAAFPNRFRFTSGYRSPAKNAAVNGVTNSFHITGQAADFVPIDGRLPAAEKGAIANMVSRYGYEVIKHDAGSGLHYHIEPAPSRNLRITTPSKFGDSSSVAVIVAGVAILILVTD